ncbi:MAG TPA: RNA degradosome polyphosphate kinase, partial [Acidocella sp.]|nr:RNA degradosome polyphosphate kinase [Acidocella sp.]
MDQIASPVPAAAHAPTHASAPALAKDDPARFINRELSWLDFNFRVVGEAQNTRHPLLERLRFVSISASNLDEFYSVRVAGLIGQERAGVLEHSADGLTPAQQLIAINAQAKALVAAQQAAFVELRRLLAGAGLVICNSAELTSDDASFLDSYFMERVFPVLTPLAVDPAHPFPFIPNMGLVMALTLARDDDRGHMSALIPLPAQIERFVRLPAGGDKIRFIMLEELVAMNMGRLFPGFTVQGSGLFRVIRDTDVEFEEEAEDLVRSYESALKRRRRGVAIALTVAADMPADLRELVIDAIEAPAEQVATETGIIGMADVKQLIVDDRPDLLFPPYTARFPERIRDFGGDCFAAIRAKDILVHHPFESF